MVNNGAEEEKGNALTKETYQLLKNSDLNFVGNVEARDLPLGACDVIVCDGFVGNVIMKLMEGWRRFIFQHDEAGVHEEIEISAGCCFGKAGAQKF